MKTLVLILNWNGLEDTRDGLRKLLCGPTEDFEVWVLDNGSRPEQASQLASEFESQCTVLRSEKNLGFAGGMNWLWERMLQVDLDGERFSEVLFLNNDARIGPEDLRALVVKLRADPKNAVVGPSLRETGTFRKNLVGPGWIKFWSGQTVFDSGDFYSQDCMCDLVHGAIFLLRRTSVSTLPFDSEYFAYYEETELCVKLAREGWNVLWTPEVCCEHRGESSSRRVSGLTEYLMMRNRVRFLLRNTSGHSSLIALFFVTPLYGMKRTLRGIFRGQIRIASMNWFGFLDGFTGRNRIRRSAGG